MQTSGQYGVGGHMEERLRFIKHQDKDVLFIDLTNTSKQDLLIILPRIKAVVTEQPRDSVLILADFTGAQIDKDVATRVKEVLVFDRPYVKKAAWVGAEDLPHVFYENFKTFSRRDLPMFKTQSEALEWLVAA
jgi:hypothetical protein